jgi:uncharacterized membrane protein YkoI
MRPILLALPALVLAGLAYSAEPAYQRDIPANLASKARITEEAAVAKALGTVPNGKVISVELEREKRQLIYSVDIQAPQRSGVEEIHVSALNGRLLSRQHESVETERKEETAEKKEAGPKLPQ